MFKWTHARAVPGVGNALCLAVVGLFAWLMGCGLGGTSSGRVSKMGSRVQVGPLIYNVLEAEWASTLGDAPEVKYPKSKFLVLRLTVTNSGVSDSAIPHFRLEDNAGNSYPEGVEGSSIAEWMGVLRLLKPAETEHGRVYFDAPVGAYKLRVTDDADPGQERVAFIEIPLRLDPDVPVSDPMLHVPATPGRR